MANIKFENLKYPIDISDFEIILPNNINDFEVVSPVINNSSVINNSFEITNNELPLSFNIIIINDIEPNIEHNTPKNCCVKLYEFFKYYYNSYILSRCIEMSLIWIFIWILIVITIIYSN
jgi:hypothetical protein